MYLRKSKKPNGRTYLTIVQGYRDEDGKNKARTVRSLGYVDALEAEFDDPVAHFEEECRRTKNDLARLQKSGGGGADGEHSARVRHDRQDPHARGR